MIVVRIVKAGEWEVVTEVKDIFGSPEQIAVTLRRKGIKARRDGRGVLVEVES